MIEAAFARKFVEQITQYTEYNINIMNENGIIIASRDPRRIGTFHEVAYRIVTGSEEFVVTTKEGDYPGVLPGINQVIMLDGKREGVVGITGNPDDVRPIALITKMAVSHAEIREAGRKAQAPFQQEGQVFQSPDPG